ncbi:hypothetical protein B0H19DRAFT_1369113 [Mycena capillaripes]|nr:hypothetical protein B0H19DRAFT_1369113 [Mycena capillaripes]
MFLWCGEARMPRAERRRCERYQVPCYFRGLSGGQEIAVEHSHVGGGAGIDEAGVRAVLKQVQPVIVYTMGHDVLQVTKPGNAAGLDDHLPSGYSAANCRRMRRRFGAHTRPTTRTTPPQAQQPSYTHDRLSRWLPSMRMMSLNCSTPSPCSD